MTRNQFYYLLKPLIPRRLQIELRRMIVARKRARYADVWPIDEKAGTPPEGWAGWPDGKKFALVLTHDVETAKGHKNCRKLMELEEKLGFRSSFGFVPERYTVSPDLRKDLLQRGFEISVHGLFHDGLYYRSREVFRKRAIRINDYLKEWGAVGFRSPSMLHNLNWLHDLEVEYDSSTFDTDPFEPQPDGVGTIFPFWVPQDGKKDGYVEMPYTLPQDHSLFILMKKKDISVWKRKLDWIAEKGGMALVISHPDYMNFGPGIRAQGEYPAKFYEEFLQYVRTKYDGQYWSVLPKEMARYWVENYAAPKKLRKLGVHAPEETKKRKNLGNFNRKKIWIDLDNSPHVPFFSPIIKELEKQGYRVVLTARDCAQTCGLADLFCLEYDRVGRHYGKSIFVKVAGTVYRALQLTQVLRKDRPAVAVSHGSRAQMLSALLMGVPSVVIMDYEHVKGFINPTWVMMPEVISNGAVKFDADRILKYHGIKEDVYVPFFQPNPTIKTDLGLRDDEIVATIRPPATEAHYHNPQSEALFSAAVNLLGKMEKTRMVIVPRNEAQGECIRSLWPEWCGSGRIIIPEHVVDGLNLLWHSDLVISGGGTMNREAAALGVPVYSIFRGKIGAVDRYLAETGRLTLLESVDDMEKKLLVKKRVRKEDGISSDGTALRDVVEGVMKALENGR